MRVASPCTSTCPHQEAASAPRWQLWPRGDGCAEAPEGFRGRRVERSAGCPRLSQGPVTESLPQAGSGFARLSGTSVNRGGACLTGRPPGSLKGPRRGCASGCASGCFCLCAGLRSQTSDEVSTSSTDGWPAQPRADGERPCWTASFSGSRRRVSGRGAVCVWLESSCPGLSLRGP